MTDPKRYREPNMENFSKLYWALGMMDLSNDEMVDNYMAINECDIYKDYKFNEFEWKNIRNSARELLKKETPTFPTRFSFMQEIRLTDYDIEKGGFHIHENYDVENSRRFEVSAASKTEEICGFRSDIPHYPRGIVVELSRPFELDFFPVNRKLAEAYIEEKMEDFRNLKPKFQTQQNLYEARTAYMEINVKLFSFTGFTRSSQYANLASTVGVLESAKIYADRDKEVLLYAKTYGQREKSDTIDPVLKEQFESFLAKRETIEVRKPGSGNSGN